jgi:molybdopterin-guanine dinucleotide biosynthesis protein A
MPARRPHAEDGDVDRRLGSRNDGPSAVILAGGASRRMGEPKAWLDVGGRPALVHVAALLRPLAADVVVVAAVDQPLPAVDGRVVRDRTPDLGPLPALALGLERIRGTHAFALGCDGVMVRPAVLALLLDECRRRDADAVIPCWGAHVHPLVAVYHRRAAAALAALASGGERRLQAATTLARAYVVPAERVRPLDPEGLSFHAMNTPAEYAHLRAAWEASRR